MLVAVCAVVPLAVDPWGLRPFLPPKNASLVLGSALVALLAAAAWLVRSSQSEPGPASAARRRPGLRDNPLIVLALLFWVWTVTAPMLTSASMALHLLGAARFTAVVGLAALALAAGVSGPQWRYRIAGAFAVTSVLMMAHALLQASGIDPFELLVGRPVQATGRWRAFTTTGNPNWTAAYLAATAPLVARVGRASRVFEWLVWTLFGAAVLATGSRLALIALLSAAAAWWWGRRSITSGNAKQPGVHGVGPSKQRYLVGSLVVLLGVAVSAQIVIRFGSALWTRWQDLGSIFGRLIHFGAALTLIGKSPWTGHGLDHFRLMLPEGLQGFLPSLGVTWQDRIPRTLTTHVHNDFLETGVEAGIVGAILLVLLWVLALRRTLVRHRLQEWVRQGSNFRQRIPLEPALGACLIALGVLALGSVPLRTPSTALLFWIVLALVAAPSHERSAGSASRQEVRGRRRGDHVLTQRDEVTRSACSGTRRWTKRASLGALFLALPVVGLAAWHGAEVISGNRAAAQAHARLAAEQYRDAEALFRRVAGQNPWDHESRVLLAGLLVARGESDEALRVLDRAERWSASREAWLVRAEALRMTGRLEQAAEVLDSAVRAVPDFLRAHLALGDLYGSLGEEARAEAAYRRVGDSSQDSPWAAALKARAQRELDRFSNEFGSQGIDNS